MEILTGKAKEKFTEYAYKEHARDASYQHGSFYDLPEICQNALIIEWFDSVKLPICFYYSEKLKEFYSNIFYSKGWSSSWHEKRSDATRAAIIQANTIFNER